MNSPNHSTYKSALRCFSALVRMGMSIAHARKIASAYIPASPRPPVLSVKTTVLTTL